MFVTRSGQGVRYEDVREAWRQVLWVRDIPPDLQAGSVIEIEGVKAIGQTPSRCIVLDFDQPFVVLGVEDDQRIIITPPIVPDGPYRSVSSVPSDGAKIKRWPKAGD